MTTSWLDQCIRQLAARQHGLFTAAQARELGFTEAMVKQRRRRGDWEVVRPGVYRLAGALPSWHQKLQMALLVAGPEAGVSHGAAAALWGLPGFPEGPVEVVAPHGRGNHRLARGRIHESRCLPEGHLKVVAGLPVTSVERTLCDLAGLVHPKRTERAVDNALARDLTSTERLWSTWAELAGRGRRGTRAMRAILSERRTGYIAPESVLEDCFLRLCKAAGIGALQKQVDLGADHWVGRVDFISRQHKLVVEVDGRVGHQSNLDRERDRNRDAELAADGWRVLRMGWTDVVSRPDWAVRTVRRALGAATMAA